MVRVFCFGNGCMLRLDLMYPHQLQTSHIIPCDRTDQIFGDCELLSTVAYPNYTRRRHGLPSDNAIPTGGQLIRVTKGFRPLFFFGARRHLVWSSQSFAEGEYEDTCRTPAFGPKPL